MHLFAIEEDAGWLELTPLLVVGFVGHALLPPRWKHRALLAVSLLGIGLVLGPTPALVLVLLGLVLIGVSHLPIPLGWRVACLLLIAAFLAGVRSGLVDVGWSYLGTLVVPVLGAMFMFRLAVYMYDTRHESEPAPLAERLSYFFMLPNVCFLLFPVVDYKTYRRSYFKRSSRDIYQKGLLWMYRGVLHLLCYRIVYYHLLPSPAQVTGLGSLLQYMLATYGLYLRISGQFHLIVGAMCLFGYDLPETHRQYFLASSFNDYWRRVNIYWKDFMMKMVYYPVFMRARRFGMAWGIVVATVVVFLGTWMLHSYQWFWLQGTFPLRAPDGVFWSILGAFVIWNALREARTSRKRSLPGTSAAFDVRSAVRHATNVVVMFSTLTVLWSMWSSATLREWIETVRRASEASALEIAMLVAAFAVLVAMGTLVQYLRHRGHSLSIYGASSSFTRQSWVMGGGLVALVALASPGTQTVLGPGATTAIASITEARLNAQDLATMERGYYEGLLDTRQYTSARWLSSASAPDDWVNIHQVDLARRTGDMLDYELVPGYEGTFLRAPYSANRWGMRDREYTLAKAPGVKRIALLGSSYEMGSGVANDQTYEARLEDMLNSDRANAPAYEVLNFAVNGYSVLQNAVVAQEKMPAFSPDVVLLASHSGEDRRLMDALLRLHRRGNTIAFPWLEEIVAESGLQAGMSATEVERRLGPHALDIIRLGYEEIAQAATEAGAIPVWVFVPRTAEAQSLTRPGVVADFRRLAEASGFHALSLEGAYGRFGPEEIQVAPWDGHPSPLGHTVLAEALLKELQRLDRSSAIGLDIP